ENMRIKFIQSLKLNSSIRGFVIRRRNGCSKSILVDRIDVLSLLAYISNFLMIQIERIIFHTNERLEAFSPYIFLITSYNLSYPRIFLRYFLNYRFIFRNPSKSIGAFYQSIKVKVFV
uniref:Maturase K n=1 Tax=Parascaris univalens TaxID=6257 RepID=A0A915C3G7_PARUN